MRLFNPFIAIPLLVIIGLYGYFSRRGKKRAALLWSGLAALLIIVLYITWLL